MPLFRRFSSSPARGRDRLTHNDMALDDGAVGTSFRLRGLRLGASAIGTFRSLEEILVILLGIFEEVVELLVPLFEIEQLLHTFEQLIEHASPYAAMESPSCTMAE